MPEPTTFRPPPEVTRTVRDTLAATRRLTVATLRRAGRNAGMQRDAIDQMIARRGARPTRGPVETRRLRAVTALRRLAEAVDDIATTGRPR